VGENYNPDDGLCTPSTETGCLPGYQPGAGNICEEIPTENCPPNTTFDPQTGDCRLDEGKQCPEGTYPDPTTNSCIQANLMIIIPQCDETNTTIPNWILCETDHDCANWAISGEKNRRLRTKPMLANWQIILSIWLHA
jgi:hypothetical protein